MRFFFPLVRILFGLIFILSGTLKLFDIASFRQAVDALEFLPAGTVPIVAWAIVVAEIILGAAVCLGLRTAVTSQIIATILVLFTAVLVTKIVEGASIACGCFGEFAQDKVDEFTILRNVILIAWALALATYSMTRSPSQSVRELHSVNCENNRPRTKVFYLARRMTITMAFFFLVAVTLTLSSQNQTLKSRLAILNAAGEALQPGDIAPEFYANALSGTDTTVSYRNREKTVLFVMKSTCKPCKTNLPIWNRIYDRVRTRNIAVLGVSVDSLGATRDFVAQSYPKFTTVSAFGKGFLSKYRVIATPHTVVIKGDTVAQTWRGVLESSEEVEILEMLLGERNSEAEESPIMEGLK